MKYLQVVKTRCELLGNSKKCTIAISNKTLSIDYLNCRIRNSLVYSFIYYMIDNFNIFAALFKFPNHFFISKMKTKISEIIPLNLGISIDVKQD